MQAALTILDGPLGSELLARGVETPLPGWSAHALDDAPDVVAAIHRDYAAAGAVVHTANTFRTRRRTFPRDWERLAAKAVALARDAVPRSHRVAGSIAPLFDCYRPDQSPADRDAKGTRAEHDELARGLAAAGVDLLLVETFPHAGEALIALDACLATGKETWFSMTAGYRADLRTPAEIGAAARDAARRGARAVLVNCVPVDRTLEFVRALVDARENEAVHVGAYANAGRPDEKDGWRGAPCDPARYAEVARGWIDAGATIVGSCCGTGPAHVAALARLATGMRSGSSR